jgi:hypothetical protein
MAFPGGSVGTMSGCSLTVTPHKQNALFHLPVPASSPAAIPVIAALRACSESGAHKPDVETAKQTLKGQQGNSAKQTLCAAVTEWMAQAKEPAPSLAAKTPEEQLDDDDWVAILTGAAASGATAADNEHEHAEQQQGSPGLLMASAEAAAAARSAAQQMGRGRHAPWTHQVPKASHASAPAARTRARTSFGQADGPRAMLRFADPLPGAAANPLDKAGSLKRPLPQEAPQASPPCHTCRMQHLRQSTTPQCEQHAQSSNDFDMQSCSQHPMMMCCANMCEAPRIAKHTLVSNTASKQEHAAQPPWTQTRAAECIPPQSSCRTPQRKTRACTWTTKCHGAAAMHNRPWEIVLKAVPHSTGG